MEGFGEEDHWSAHPPLSDVRERAVGVCMGLCRDLQCFLWINKGASSEEVVLYSWDPRQWVMKTDEMVGCGNFFLCCWLDILLYQAFPC